MALIIESVVRNGSDVVVTVWEEQPSESQRLVITVPARGLDTLTIADVRAAIVQRRRDDGIQPAETDLARDWVQRRVD